MAPFLRPSWGEVAKLRLNSSMNQTLPIIAYHIVFGAYGFWLPNDPRGSWVRSMFWVESAAGPSVPATQKTRPGIRSLAWHMT